MLVIVEARILMVCPFFVRRARIRDARRVSTLATAV